MAKRQARLISRIWVSSLTPEQRLDIKEKTAWKWNDNLFQFEKNEYANRISENIKQEEKSELRKKIATKIDDRLRLIKNDIPHLERWARYVIIPELNEGCYWFLIPHDSTIDPRFRQKLELYEWTLVFANNLQNKLLEIKRLLYGNKYSDDKIDEDVKLYIFSKYSNQLIFDMYKSSLEKNNQK